MIPNELTFCEVDAIAQLRAMDRCTVVGRRITDADSDAFEGASNFYSELVAVLRREGQATVRLVARGECNEHGTSNEGPNTPLHKEAPDA
jgi:hypothetical protein